MKPTYGTRNLAKPLVIFTIALLIIAFLIELIGGKGTLEMLLDSLPDPPSD